MEEIDEINEINEINEIDEYESSEIVFNKTTEVENIHTFINDYENKKKTYVTSNLLTKYERTKILCERAQQIENGSPPYIANFERYTNSQSIATEELNRKLIPFIIRRSIPHSTQYEYWKLKDMIY